MPSLNNDGFDLPLAKRQKRTISQDVERLSQASGSKIFSSFRALGLVSTDVPFTCVRLGKSTFQITTSVGRSLQTYDLKRGLNLVFISRPQTPESITATFAWQDRIFAAWGNLRPGSGGGIWVFKRGKRVASLQLPSGFSEPIDRLLVFGSWIIGSSSKYIQVWKNTSYQHYTTLSPQRVKDLSEGPVYTGQICNMPTYLNKIFVGRYDGKVDIWNVKTGKLIYSMLPVSPQAGAVTALQPSPALSLIAIAYKGGMLSICNIETGQLIISLRTDSQQMPCVTSLAFRHDGLGAGEHGRSPGMMATGCMDSGDITIWDLNNGGRAVGILRRAHRTLAGESGSGISHIQFLDGQPVMVSSGKDNSLKTWIFDEIPFSYIPRPLHSRSGHSAAITTLSFLPSASDGSEFSGKWLLSTSKDCSLWGFSVRKDSQNTEISQGAVEHKTKRRVTSTAHGGATHTYMDGDFRAPEITCIACSLNRDGGMGNTTSGPIWTNPKATRADDSSKTGWESIVTGHRGDKYARTWFWGKKKAGRWAFETSDKAEVKSVAISSCGTFAMVGSAGGAIDMYNMQSGLHRQSFPTASFKETLKEKSRFQHVSENHDMKHTKAVTGLMIDGLNRTVVSCGLDGKVKFWNLVSGRLIDQLDWYPMTSINGLRISPTNELVAFSCDDLSIRVVDVETRKVIREFWGCVGQINDFTFSNDGRWIIAASMDSTIRVWDLPTGHLIDVFRVSSTCTSLAMSSTGEFLATAHADGVGISLWSNKSLFIPISTRNVDDHLIGDVSIPTSSSEGGPGVIEAAFAEKFEQSELEGPLPSVEQLSGDMVTLSVVPKSKWQTLLQLNLIKERNKPKTPPKAPQKAPFFLPASPEQTLTDGDIKMSIEGTLAERSRITRMHSSNSTAGIASTRFTSLLHSGYESGNFDLFVEHLKGMPPTKADLEIRSLDPQLRDGYSELSAFVTALSNRLGLRRDFEVVNAWMAVFLRIHADTVAECSRTDAYENNALKAALADWSRALQQEAQRLAGLVGYCRGVVGFLRSTR
ncbi:Utp21-domain-containing protein [Aspergillus sclerotioniger CBS 115572]|uniref:Utp21-domain-containing protein n=1 Tax=Aspergillus sclerotioniger CBS 115572 TaxID=1450535 RepID=A0A317XG14_9EURO|nr:Utp21-domain-containing protein [Aspergillus sclerotioniger CBS 115572]PWY96807.1 Utp21-domain-containing protein [Aspergillus sclerotioniger CBS 115572]